MLPGLVRRRPLDGMAPLLLLVATLACAALLGGEAWRAHRAQRATTERALAEYAAFASAQFVERAVRVLVDAVSAAWVLPAPIAAGAAAPLAPRALPLQRPWCRCLDSARAFFAVPLRDAAPVADSLRVADGTLSTAERRWILGAVATRAREFAQARATLRRVDATATLADLAPPAAPRSPLHEVALYFPRVDGRNLALVFAIAADEAGAPRAVYGFVSEPVALLRPLVTRLLRGTPVLPAAVVRGLPNDSVIVVRLAGTDGRVAFASVPAEASRYGTSDYAATDTLSRQPGSLRFTIALRADALPRLAVPQPSPVRLAALLAALALSLAGGMYAALRLRRASALAQARAAFVGGVSHELRTPLTQIRLFAELLQDPVLRSDEERLRWARIIDQEARRLGFLVENVLRFARSDGRAVRVTPTAVDAAELLEEVLQAFAPIAAARGTMVRTEIPPDAPPLLADPGALRHVLVNLLDNAVKYGPEGQTVTVRLEAGAREARLVVDDEGPGIPPPHRARVWAPYERLARDGATGGSGIGLAIVRELVALQRGRVDVLDAPGGGARFVVALPVAAPEAAPARAPHAARAVPTRT